LIQLVDSWNQFNPHHHLLTPSAWPLARYPLLSLPNSDSSNSFISELDQINRIRSDTKSIIYKVIHYSTSCLYTLTVIYNNTKTSYATKFSMRTRSSVTLTTLTLLNATTCSNTTMRFTASHTCYKRKILHKDEFLYVFNMKRQKNWFFKYFLMILLFWYKNYKKIILIYF
jgi:hypothetical protein